MELSSKSKPLLLLLLLLFTFSSVSESNQFCDAGIEYGEPGCGISSSSLKILIKGGTVVNAHKEEVADVYVEDGIIIAVKPNIKVGDDVTVLDATGKFVMPGGIDPHTHLAVEHRGLESIDDFFSGQAAALAGGTTMHIDFVFPVRDSLTAGLEAYKKKAKKSCMDYGFHMTITKWDEVVSKEMEIMVKEKGINSFKFFMAYKGAVMINDEILLEGLKKCKSLGALAMVHAENGDAVYEGQKRMIELGIIGPEGHALSRPPMLEGEATSRAIRLAGFVNTPLYVVHVMSIDAMEEIATARKQGRRRPQVSLEEFSFLEKVCKKTTPEERTWAKLVNPRTIHWYCDGPEPTQEAIRYDERVHKQMDDAKRRALIKSQAVKKRESGEEVPKASASVPKRKLTTKSDRPFKQPKVSLEPVVGLMAEGNKAVTPAKQGKGKGLMAVPDGKQERPPSLLRDDSKYALEKLSSIITAEDYEDLGNHSTEAMGETGLFAVAQSLVMMKGLLDRCLNRESSLDRVRAKAQQTEEELGQLQRWRSKMEKKLELSEQARKELEEKTATSLTVIENKEAEIKQLKEEIRQARVAAVEEYRCSESCLGELSDSFLQGFDDSLRQVKKAYPELDLTMVKLEDQAQTSALPVASENTEDLFGDGAAQGDGESAPSKDVPDAEEKKD